MAKQVSAAKYNGYLVKCPKCKAKSFFTFKEVQYAGITVAVCPLCGEHTYKNRLWKKANYPIKGEMPHD